MNDHSSIVRLIPSPLARRFRSRAFRSGLREGFGAPALLWGRNEYKLLSTVDASVADAWKAVGDVIKASAEKQGGQIGKSTREVEPAE
jgi:hypothetical protein